MMPNNTGKKDVRTFIKLNHDLLPALSPVGVLAGPVVPRLRSAVVLWSVALLLLLLLLLAQY